MFNADGDQFFKRILANWFLFTMFSIFSVVVQPKALAAPLAVCVVILTYWSVVCAFRTERFSQYATLRLFYTVALVPVMASTLLLMVLHKDFSLSPVLAISIGCIPLLVAGVSYFFMTFWNSPESSLVVHGESVEVVEVPRKGNTALGGVAAVGGSLSFPLFQQYDSAYLFMVSVLVLVSLYMIISNRVNICSLRTLKERELREKCRFTFSNIDEIRKRRTTSLLGRILSVKVEH